MLNLTIMSQRRKFDKEFKLMTAYAARKPSVKAERI
jgi:hypothetical protein